MTDSRETPAEQKIKPDIWETGLPFLLVGAFFAVAGSWTVYVQYPCLNSLFVALLLLGFGVYQRKRYLRGDVKAENPQAV